MHAVLPSIVQKEFVTSTAMAAWQLYDPDTDHASPAKRALADNMMAKPMQMREGLSGPN